VIRVTVLFGRRCPDKDIEESEVSYYHQIKSRAHWWRFMISVDFVQLEDQRRVWGRTLAADDDSVRHRSWGQFNKIERPQRGLVGNEMHDGGNFARDRPAVPIVRSILRRDPEPDMRLPPPAVGHQPARVLRPLKALRGGLFEPYCAVVRWRLQNSGMPRFPGPRSKRSAVCN
jgi:hypothetical protein